MATTYGYGGEFSSDDDLDRLEQQQSDRMVQSKFDNNSRPGKRQIEDMIGSIKALPFDQEIQLSDEFLAGLLDYYKTPRGPIVDSTRKLYHKIALRLIRGEQPKQADDNAKETNGNSNLVHSSNNNNNNNNNNSIDVIPSVYPQQRADTYSSDEDDEPVVVHRKIFVETEDDSANDENKMDVDQETPTGPVRETKQVDLSSTDEDSGSSDESSESEELNSESDVLDATPIKAPAVSREKEAVEALMAARPSTPRQPESLIKRQPLAQSTPKENTETAKKPYTRSQRVATRSATRGTRATEITSKSNPKASTSADVFIENKRTSSKKYVLLGVTLLTVVLAFLLYYFRSNITNSAAPLLGKKIMF